MVTKQWISWRSDDGREPSEKLQRSHDAMLGAAVSQLLDAIRDASARQASEPVEGDRGTRTVSHQPLAPQVIVASDCDARLQVEAVVLDGTSVDLGRIEAWQARLLCARVIMQSANRSTLHRDGRTGIE
jgi:hypothetical protein